MRQALNGVQFLTVNTAAEADLKQTIGTNIVIARKRVGLSQRKLAKALGIEPSRMGQYEHGRYTPGNERLLEIARITSAPSVGWFFDPHPDEATS